MIEKIEYDKTRFLLPQHHVVYPPDAETIIDVTKSPYFADPTGVVDCTEILCRILGDITRPNIEGCKRVTDRLEAATEDFIYENSFENRRENGRNFAVFPDRMPPSRILYFPKGTYLVSNTICYHFDNLQNGLGVEMNWCIRFQGEFRDECIIKLADESAGFEFGSRKPVVSFMRGFDSNVSMSNYFRNLTIDVGAGNPGAIGLNFFCSNDGAVRDVRILSSDPERKGYCGLTSLGNGVTGCLLKNIEVVGFEFGIQLTSLHDYVVMENIRVSDQRAIGIRLENTVAVLRNIQSENEKEALHVDGETAHVHLLDSHLAGGHSVRPAIVHAKGVFFARNIRCDGYLCGIGPMACSVWPTDITVPGTHIEEYSSHGIQTVEKTAEVRSLNLPIEDLCIDWIADPSEWVHPKIYGAVADGVSDDSDAIQAALDSGKSVVYFQPGDYVINRPLRVPKTVKRINGMFVDIVAGEEIKSMADVGMFTIGEDSDEPLLIEDFFSFERNFGKHFFVEHAAKRTLKLRDMHLQACAAYRNSVSGSRVYLENIATTTGLFNSEYERPCFHFVGQQVWARQLNPEYAERKIINDGGSLVVLGYKTEGHGINFSTLNHGQSEILSGILLFGGNNEVPCLLNQDSDVGFSGVTVGRIQNHHFPWPIKEIKNGETKRLTAADFPKRYKHQFTIPMYVGRGR